MKLIEKEARGRFVFVGDTCGDLEASERVLDRYLNSETTLVFLGNYAGCGPKSKENIDFLLDQRKKSPDSVYLLQGNHENYKSQLFCPSGFWDSLDEGGLLKYTSEFGKLPFVFSVGDIIAVHGVPPDVNRLRDVSEVEILDGNWDMMLWGDFYENSSALTHGGKSVFGREYFDRVMEQLGKNVLVRGHQSRAKRSMFDGKCLTIFTSGVHGGERTVAIADFDKKDRIRSIDDLTVEVV